MLLTDISRRSSLTRTVSILRYCPPATSSRKRTRFCKEWLRASESTSPQETIATSHSYKAILRLTGQPPAHSWPPSEGPASQSARQTIISLRRLGEQPHPHGLAQHGRPLHPAHGCTAQEAE